MMTGLEWIRTICRSRQNIPAMCRSMYDVSERIFTKKFYTNLKEKQTCGPTGGIASLIVPVMRMSWLEADSRRRSAAGRIYFLYDG